MRLPNDALGGSPLSYGQQSQWYAHQVLGATAIYHDFAAFRVLGPLNLAALQVAVERTIDRHEVLRARFIDDGTELRHVIDPRWRGSVAVAWAPPGDDFQAALDDFFKAEVEKPFDLAADALFRVSVLTFDDQSHVIAFIKHRTIADCWSQSLLLAELAGYYAQALAGKDITRSAPERAYSDFVRWQRSPEQHAEFDELLEFWTDHIGDAPRELRLRSGDLGDSTLSATPQSAEELEFHIPAATVNRLQELATASGATLYMTLLGAFGVVVAQAAHTRDVLVGVPVAGRTMIEFEEAAGYFANLLPLRVDQRDDPTGTDLLRRVRKAMLGGMAHQDLPFEVLLARLGLAATLDRHPLVQVAMQLIDGSGSSDLLLEGLTVMPLPVDEYQIAYSLALNLYAGLEGLRGRLIYTVGEVEPMIAADIVRRFRNLVDLLPEHPGSAVSGLLDLAARGPVRGDGDA